MQPSILFLLLGCVAVVNCIGIDLGFLNPFRTSDEPRDRQLPPANPSMCNPMEPRTLIRNARAAQLLRDDFVPLPTLAPTNNPGDFGTRNVVPLPTLAPTNNQRDFSRKGYVPLPTFAPSEGDRKGHPSSDCDPHPTGIGTRLSGQLLKILTILG